MSTTPRIAFLDSWLRSPQEGSGTTVAISGLAGGLAALGCRVDRVELERALDREPAGALPRPIRERLRPGRLPSRIAYNLALARDFDPAPFDAVVGFDVDGCFLGRISDAGGGPVRAVYLKGVAADERRFEAGLARARFAVLSALEKRNVRRVQRVLVTSAYCLDRASVAYGVERERFHIVPEGIDLDAWDRLAELSDRPATRERAGPPVLLNVARQFRRKDTRTLLDALPAVARAHPEVVLRVVGGGPELPALIARTAELDLRERVTFLGEVPDDDAVRREYLAADLFCLPSRQEGFGIALLEAMASGTPIVAARAGAIPEVAPDGEVAALVPPGEPEALAAELVRLLDDPPARRRLGAAGRRRARAHDWPSVARRFLEALELG